jgi:hypothetical protein
MHSGRSNPRKQEIWLGQAQTGNDADIDPPEWLAIEAQRPPAG